ncbi:MAG: FAD-dependent oxidoreductase [Halothiobacillaceae bacterium]
MIRQLAGHGALRIKNAEDVMGGNFDIVIVGGGMVGSVLAHALADDGWQVAVIEAAPQDSPSFDERVTALSEGSWRYLESLGLVTDRLRAHAQAIREVRVSQRGHPGLTRIGADEMGVAALGRVTCNRALREALESRPSWQAVRRLEPARFVSFTMDDDSVRVTAQAGEEPLVLSARLLVAADGVHSAVREAAGLGARFHDYGQDAVIARVRPGRAHDGIAFEHFTDSGPLAVLPMTEGLCSVVLTVWREDSAQWQSLSDDEFARRLTARFGGRLGDLAARPGRAVYPLGLSEVELGKEVEAGNLVGCRCRPTTPGDAAAGAKPQGQ